MSIIEEIKREMVRGIESVINEKEESFKSELPIPPEWAAEFLESQGFEKGDLGTNGWQYDWWLHFTKADQSFTASGSGYYGGFEFAPTE